jgi:hypothetical protein
MLTQATRHNDTHPLKIAISTPYYLLGRGATGYLRLLVLQRALVGILVFHHTTDDRYVSHPAGPRSWGCILKSAKRRSLRMPSHCTVGKQ